MSTKPYPAADYEFVALHRGLPRPIGEGVFGDAATIESLEKGAARILDQHAAHVEALLRSHVAAGVPLGSFAVIEQPVPPVPVDAPTEVVKRTDVSIDGRLVGSVLTVRDGLVYRVTVEARS